jgi:hypothetical protein
MNWLTIYYNFFVSTTCRCVPNVAVKLLYGRHHKLVDRYEIAISQMNVWVTRRGSYKKQGLLTLGEHLGSPWGFGGEGHYFEDYGLPRCFT